MPSAGRLIPDLADETGRQEARHGAWRAGDASVRGDRGVLSAGGRLPPPRAGQAALHDGFPLEAGMDQAGPSSGDDTTPSPLERQLSGPAVSDRRRRPRGKERAFVNGGGVAAQFAQPSASAAFEVPALGEALTLFPPSSAGTEPHSCACLDRQCRWSSKRSGSFETRRSSRWKPQARVCQQTFVRGCSSTRSCSSTFPFLSVLLRELERWAWMLGRWVIADVADMINSSDLLHGWTKADERAARLSTLAAQLRLLPGLPVSQTLLQEMTQLLLRFTMARAGAVRGGHRQYRSRHAGPAGIIPRIRDHLSHLRTL